MRYICQICGYIYDDAKEKVPFDALPEGWKCPLCGAAKSDFRPEETGKPKETIKPSLDGAAKSKETSKPDAEAAGDLKELPAGVISAICSNLARGCEKQYKNEEAALFKEIADYYAFITPETPDASVEKMAALLQADIENYGSVRETADAAGDRGAARICVWGEKVTRMLYSLINRYRNEGEAMLADTHIWVCTICGFVYIGNEAPKLCPVCKVPDWKFEKIEGRA